MSSTPEDPLRAQLAARKALRFLEDRYGHTVESDGEDNWERFGAIEKGLAALAAPPVAGAEDAQTAALHMALIDRGIYSVGDLGIYEHALRSAAPALDVERLAEAIDRTKELWFGGDRDSWWLADPVGMAADIAREYAALERASGDE